MTDSPGTPPRKPRDEEIDVWGLTHVGKVRKTNEDHFLIGSLKKQLDVKLTSLPSLTTLPATQEQVGGEERIAFLAMIADGVGGRMAGEEASRMTLEEVSQYVTQSTNTYYQGDPLAEGFIDRLEEAALRSHRRIRERAQTDTELRGMATTLTVFLGVWPWVYLLQVGDSRYYLYARGVLTQISRDQTMAQELVDQGVMTRTVAYASRWANVLSSSIGGEQTAPVVTRIPNSWEYVHLLCSDGLTKHVSDERIAERLSQMTSAKQVCEALLQDALDDGGTDNVTIIVGRSVMQASA
jgi:protein phosphatase